MNKMLVSLIAILLAAVALVGYINHTDSELNKWTKFKPTYDGAKPFPFYVYDREVPATLCK